MIVGLYILIALVITGTVLYLHHRHTADENRDVNDTPDAESDDVCCGMHVTCEKDSLLAAVSDEIIYYDDEELDRFRGMSPDSYTDSDIEEFRNVLLTLLPSDIAGWGRSIQLRGIELPDTVRDELLLIVAEARDRSNHRTA